MPALVHTLWLNMLLQDAEGHGRLFVLNAIGPSRAEEGTLWRN